MPTFSSESEQISSRHGSRAFSGVLCGCALVTVVLLGLLSYFMNTLESANGDLPEGIDKDVERMINTWKGELSYSVSPTAAPRTALPLRTGSPEAEQPQEDGIRPWHLNCERHDRTLNASMALSVSHSSHAHSISSLARHFVRGVTSIA